MLIHRTLAAYACPLETCTKTFAVRSNARRHLRTHGITSGSSSTRTTVKPEPPFEVSFDTPLVASPSTALDMHFQRPRSGKKPRVPASLTTRKNAARLRSLSPGSDMADLDADMDDEEDGEYQYKYQYYRPPGPAKKVPVPLPPVKPSEPSEDPDEKFEERDSSAEAGTFPYHPEQVRALPSLSSSRRRSKNS
ncbi:hypothetical protein BD410DRAFT_784967 [Rickenella mellea]|uniref:C2H2-type domain-containing protein n=1 Tax=Rickenella mellea TaxID=50990 RepID=A0A4Y7QBU9_9AGAM|nr:hypothetical protein BD410DRAFT_784967 [Rickenella mellea]